MTVDFSKIEIREAGKNSYFVFDQQSNQMILEVQRRSVRGNVIFQATSAESRNVDIYDVRGTSGEKRLLKSIPGRQFNVSHLNEIVLNALDELMCQVCLKEWGPVCARCHEEAADALFLSYRQIERLATGE